ncbi:hypothetical protein PIS_101 [Saccharomonospora phage PIS 136]|nr:hypothetical protein PIS_101 [Saccharomonospora phage PIS 136]
MAAYSSAAPSIQSSQYACPTLSEAVNSAAAQDLPVFSPPSTRINGHDGRPVGLRVRSFGIGRPGTARGTGPEVEASAWRAALLDTRGSLSRLLVAF